MRIAVMASGNGSNFEAIVQAANQGGIQGEIALLFCDQKKAYVLERSQKLNVPSVQFSPKDFLSKAEYERALKDLFLEHQIDLIILAGYMRIIGPTLLKAFPKRIINIHPSLLPSFPGLHGIQEAYDYGVKVTGITIHYIDEGVDTGPIIMQATVDVSSLKTLEEWEEKIHQLEHVVYPKVIGDIVKKLLTNEE